LESIAEWQVKATTYGEDGMGGNATKKTAKGEPANRAVGLGDRGDQKVDYSINRSGQQREAEQRRTCHSSRVADAAAAMKRWSGWTAPKNCLGSRWISTSMLRSS
jgi:hypothetical protein